MSGFITDVEGIRVGNYSDIEHMTGCTVVLPPDGTLGSCEWRGGAPGDREWVLLQPTQRIDRVHAVVLSGGSAFGLATADGVMNWLEERDIGWLTAGNIRVPIVPTAILFDLDPSSDYRRFRPGPAEGVKACESATDGAFDLGNAGAGCGCTVGTHYGIEYSMKGGLGSASARDGDVVVGALVAANPVGDVLDSDGSVLAGSRAPAGTPPMRLRSDRENTMLGVLATNATLDKQEAQLFAKAGQDGVSSVVRPAHTRYDGDVVFGLSTRRIEAPVDQVLAMAPGVLAEAIRTAVRSAKTLGDFPGLAG